MAKEAILKTEDQSDCCTKLEVLVTCAVSLSWTWNICLSKPSTTSLFGYNLQILH